MPKSRISSPRRLASLFIAVTMLKTYGGRRVMRENASTGPLDPECAAE
jgi:hypothetical protein